MMLSNGCTIVLDIPNACSGDIVFSIEELSFKTISVYFDSFFTYK